MPPRIIKNDYTAPRPLAASLLSRRPIPTPTGPPTAGAAVAAGSSSTAENPDAYLERAEKEWNERVDGEVEGLAAGPRGLVELISSLSTPLSPLSLPLLSSRLRSSAEELLRISHELKLLLLLSIPDGSGEERAALQAEIEELRKEVASLMGDGEVVKGDDGSISIAGGQVAVET